MFESNKDFVEHIDALINHLNDDKSRSDFLKNIIKKYNCDSAIKDEIVNHLHSVKMASLINAKKFTYTNSIISLYGFLENFMESIAREFIINLNTIQAPFLSLPKEIRSSHLELSIDLLKKVQRNRAQNKEQKITLIKSVIANMNSCAQEDATYQLNEHAFSIHSSNFRYDAIHNLFCKIGIHGVPRLALRNPKLRNSLAKKHTVSSNIEEKILLSLLISELDDLAPRRNEIAHGSFDGDLESVEMVIERALLLKGFGNSVSEVLIDYFHDIVFLSSSKNNIGKPDKTYNGSCVFGFIANQSHNNGETTDIKVGDMLFAVNDASNNKVKYGKIVSIVNNKLPTESIQLPSLTDFAIKVDFEFSAHMDNRRIYTVAQA